MPLPLALTLIALLLCAMLFPPLRCELLRPRRPARRLVILPIEKARGDLELLLRYELERARQEKNSTLFLFTGQAGEEDREIAARLARGEPNLLCGDLTLLQGQIANTEVYKLVEIVLY